MFLPRVAPEPYQTEVKDVFLCSSSNTCRCMQPWNVDGGTQTVRATSPAGLRADRRARPTRSKQGPDEATPARNPPGADPDVGGSDPLPGCWRPASSHCGLDDEDVPPSAADGEEMEFAAAQDYPVLDGQLRRVGQPCDRASVLATGEPTGTPTWSSRTSAAARSCLPRRWWKSSPRSALLMDSDTDASAV